MTGNIASPWRHEAGADVRHDTVAQILCDIAAKA
jgi:hypothetical protein